MDRFEIINLLHKLYLRPRKNLGQNFLIDESILSVIIKEAGVKKEDKIIEIGPGLGTLTQALLSRGARVTAIEFDKKLFEILKKKFKTEANLNLICGDALDEITKIELRGHKIIANLPYQITSPFFRKVLSQKHLPKMIVVMVQKEMAERIAAPPHSSKRGFLSLLVQLYGQPRILRLVSKESFYPEPKVESAILTLEVKPLSKNIDKIMILKIIQAGFSQKRKKLRNSLAGGLRLEPKEADKILQKTGIDSNLRAEDLRIKDWERISKIILFERSEN